MGRVLAMQNEGANDERATPGRAQPVARAFFHNQPLDREFDAELAAHRNSRSKQTCGATSLFGNFIDRLMGDISKWLEDAL